MQRTLYADVLRIVATGLVVLQHTATSAWYTGDVETSEWIALNFYNCISRFGVGIFVMLSGMFLLNPERKYAPKQIAFGKTLHIARLIAFWVILYGIVNCICSEATLEEFLKTPLLIITKPATHLWFLYMIAGLYLLTPTLRVFTKEASKKIQFFTIFIIFLFGSLLPTVSFVSARYLDFDLYKNIVPLSSSTFIAYYLAGHFFANFEIQKKWKIALHAVAAISLVFMFAVSTYNSIVLDKPSEYFLGNHRPTTFIIALSIFVLCKDIFANKVTTKFWAEVSLCTLGIYLIHPLIVKSFYGLGGSLYFVHPAISVPVCASIFFGLSLVTVYLLKKIPFPKGLL